MVQCFGIMFLNFYFQNQGVTFSDIVGIISDFVTIFALIVGAFVAIFVFLHFAPRMTQRISSSWTSEHSRWVILRLEVENQSNVRIRSPKVFLQVLEYEYPTNKVLSEFVPFSEKAVEEDQQPVIWNEPIHVFTSTVMINPGEVIAVERLCYCPKDRLLKVGLQTKLEVGRLGRLLGFVSRVRGWRTQRTATSIIMKDNLD